MKKIALLAAAAALLLAAPRPARAGATLNLTPYKDAAALKAHAPEIVTVKLAGMVNHFGKGDIHTTVADVDVRVAEHPGSEKLGIKSGADGWWRMDVIKYKGKEESLSFVFSKKGWITTKTNVIPIGDADDTDLAIQFVDPMLYKTVIRPRVKDLLAASRGKEKFVNAVVVTVGKSWASMHDDRLPHGDPGATATVLADAAGPIYFDESVMPNAKYTRTSVDGGVAWLNVPPGTHKITAEKQGVNYSTVTFVVENPSAPGAPVLYVASPPDSVQGDNPSPPGEN